MNKRRQRGDDRIGYVCVCYTPGYWGCVWKGCPRAKGMGKHGETELTRLTWIFGFFWYGRKFGSGFLIGMFGREKLILGF